MRPLQLSAGLIIGFVIGSALAVLLLSQVQLPQSIQENITKLSDTNEKLNIILANSALAKEPIAKIHPSTLSQDGAAMLSDANDKLNIILANSELAKESAVKMQQSSSIQDIAVKLSSANDKLSILLADSGFLKESTVKMQQSSSAQDIAIKLSSANDKLGILLADSALLKEWIAKNTPSTPDASSELSVFEKDMSEGDFQAAYDDLLAAMRIAPESEKVFAASIEYIRKAITDTQEDGANLPHDIYQRAANLIPFLPLAQLKKARLVHTQIGDELFADKGNKSLEDPLTEVEALLKAARRTSLPLHARSRLMQEVEAELGNQAKRFATMGVMKPKEDEDFWNGWGNAKVRHDSAQRELLAALYDSEVKPQLVDWEKKVTAFSAKAANASIDDIRKDNELISTLIGDGERLLRDLAGYLEAAVPDAINDSQTIGPAKHLRPLANLREWNYNRWTIDRIEKVNQSGGTGLEKLKSLSVIDEGRLAPYVGQTFNDAWKKLFDACSTDDKIKATKLRIMRDFKS